MKTHSTLIPNCGRQKTASQRPIRMAAKNSYLAVKWPVNLRLFKGQEGEKPLCPRQAGQEIASAEGHQQHLCELGMLSLMLFIKLCQQMGKKLLFFPGQFKAWDFNCKIIFMTCSLSTSCVLSTAYNVCVKPMSVSVLDEVIRCAS